MASSKVMATSRSSDLKRKLSSCSSSSAADFLRGNAPESNLAHSDSVPVNEFLRNPYVDTSSSQVRPDESSSGKLLNEEITLFDVVGGGSEKTEQPRGIKKTVDDVWREIVAGKKSKSSEPQQRQQQQQQQPKEEMMTLEDFLVKAAAVEEEEEESKKGVVFKIKKEKSTGSFYGYEDNSSAIGRVGSLDIEGSLGMGRGKRSMSLLEPLDKASQQRQRRMIKNRESAARSRERKQAYQVELESMAVRLEEENEQLLREKAERTKKRLKQLMENVIPVVEKRRPRRLRRMRSM